jgi:type I restriction enzyme M protein
MKEHKTQLAQQLWITANTLRGKIDANYFRDYITPFIFYKYLNTKMELYANAILATYHLSFDQVEGYGQEAALIAQI